MTIEQSVRRRLEHHGMMPSEAAEVIALAKHQVFPIVLWDVSVDSYVTEYLDRIFYDCKDIAIKYLEEHKPDHLALKYLRSKS